MHTLYGENLIYPSKNCTVRDLTEIFRCHPLHCLIYFHASHVYPGLEGVSDLRYRSNDSTALWMSSLPYNPAVIFAYELFEENGTTIQSSSVTDAELHLPELEHSKSYVLDVWEQCDGLWKSQHSRLCFQGNNLSLTQFIEAIRLDLDQGQFALFLAFFVFSVSLVGFYKRLTTLLYYIQVKWHFKQNYENCFKMFFL